MSAQPERGAARAPAATGDVAAMSPPLPRWFGYASCFLTGLVVLVLELLAFRLLAPYFGTSSYVVGAIINTILLALAIGYLIGGYCADRYRSPRLPYWVILLCALYLSAVFAYYPQWLRLFAAYPVIAGSFAAVAMLFFIPMIALAFVPPYLIKLLLVERREGEASGLVFSVGTLGSIAGGLLTTFYFIPQLGSRLSLQISVVVLFLLAAAGLARGRPVYALLAPLALLPTLSSPPPPGPGSVFQGESEYNVVTVARAYGRHLLLLNDNLGIQSVSLDPHSHLAEHFYTDDFLLPLLLRPARRALILGNAAGTTMTSISHHFDCAVDGVEIDPLLSELGERYFALDADDERLRIFHQDGRRFLYDNSVREERLRYDLIVIDMYGGGPYVPFHVATVEFFQSVEQSLSDDGVMAVDLPFFDQGGELQRHYLNTIGRVFPYAWRVGQVLYATRAPVWSRESLTAALTGPQPTALRALTDYWLAELRPVTFDPASDDFFSDDSSSIEALTFAALDADWLAAERAARRERLGY